LKLGEGPPPAHLDALDIAIFRELMQPDVALPLSSNPLRSLRSIAKRLEVDKDTIRKRIQRLQRERFLSSPFVFPNPVLLGFGVEQYWVDLAPGFKDDVIGGLLQHERVIVISSLLGDALIFAALRGADESTGTEDRILGGIEGIREFRSAEIPFPRSEINLTSQDWRIVQSFQGNPKQSLVSLSREVGLSPRTVKRRLERMTGNRALFVIPRFDPRALDGTLVDLTVFYEADARKADIDSRILNSLRNQLFHADLGRTHSFFNLIVNNVAKAEETLRWVQSLPGVARARLDFVLERIELTGHMQELIARHPQTSPKNRRAL